LFAECDAGIIPSPGDRPGFARVLHHRILTAEAVARHTLFRQETRWPGYYYRADHPKLDDDSWHVFTGSRYDARTREWHMSKLPVHHII
jgi:adenylylsulfate reductase, subunit A